MSALPYVLRRLHKNAQRSSSFVLCTAKAPRSRSAAAAQVGAAYSAALSQRVPVSVDASERVMEYLVYKKIEHTRQEVADTRTESWASRMRRGEGSVEIQDWYLSDPALPSSTGRESAASAVETVGTCQELQLISERTLTVEPYGELLLALGEDTGIKLSASAENPFAPRPQVVMALFAQLLRCDLPFQRELAAVMLPGDMRFTEELTQVSPQIFRSVIPHVPATPGNRQLIGWLEAQLSSAQALAARKHPGDKVIGRTGRRVAPQTVLRNLENAFLPRMELLVDAGLVIKPQPGDYVYRLARSHAVFSDLLRGGTTRFESSFFASWAAIRGVQSEPITNDAAILNHLRSAYARLKGLTGYAGINESVVYANAMSMGPKWRFVEFSEATRALRDLAASQSPAVRVISDRFRRVRDFAVLP